MKNLFVFILLLASACQFNNKDKRQELISKTVQSVDVGKKRFVVDEVNLLDESEEIQLSSQIHAFYDISDIKILTIITPSYKEFGSEENYTDYFLYNYDGDARQKLILIVLFSEDEKIFIRTNKKTEQYYSNEKCMEIIELYMLPSFKNGEFYKGLHKGISEIITYKNTL